MAEKSSLLINEPPLQALPTLAKILGLDKAVILQQIQYWLLTSPHLIEGHNWIYNSYPDWAKQFPWLTDEGVRYHIRRLEKEGYLIAGKFNRDTRDKTKWYRISYDKLEGVLKTTHDAEKTTLARGRKLRLQEVENYAPLPETTTIDYLTEIKESDIEVNLKALLSSIAKLPYWGSGKIEEDTAWLIEFLSEFPELSEQLIKECRDFWDGKQRPRGKGDWKNRLRNWSKNARRIAANPRSRPISQKKAERYNLPDSEDLEKKAEALGFAKGGT